MPSTPLAAVRTAELSCAAMDDERERRLAEALRTNLRRRKAQARGEEPTLPPEPAPPER